MFAVKAGDVVTVTAKLVDGKYQFTYTNGDKSMTWKYNANDDFAGVFEWLGSRSCIRFSQRVLKDR